MNVVIPDHIDISNEARAKLKGMGAIIYDDVPDEAEVIDRIKDAELITANYIDITHAIIDSAPKLKYIVVPAVGYEWVDYEYAKTKGIQVLNCPTHNGLAVAEHAIGLMFAVQRKITESNISLQDGNWEPKDFKGVELSGSKLGLVGYGKIAKQVASMAKGLNMVVDFVDSKSSQEEWKSLMSQSDIVCICLPQTDSTKHIINAEKLGLMKPSAIIINVGRGSTIDSEALKTCLQEKRIAGAGIDVYENEPLSGKPSEQIVSLSRSPNTVATPHIAYNTQQTADRLSVELITDIESCVSGKPVNVVN